jgi:hypothetical protein
MGRQREIYSPEPIAVEPAARKSWMAGAWAGTNAGSRRGARPQDAATIFDLTDAAHPIEIVTWCVCLLDGVAQALRRIRAS